MTTLLTCGQCDHWQFKGTQPRESGGGNGGKSITVMKSVGLCYEKPPTVVAFPSPDGTQLLTKSAYPPVDDDERACGRFKPSVVPIAKG